MPSNHLKKKDNKHKSYGCKHIHQIGNSVSYKMLYFFSTFCSMIFFIQPIDVEFKYPKDN